MWSRRAFLRAGGAIGASALAVRTNGLNEIAAASAAVADRSPEEVAADESYWREIQAAFDHFKAHEDFVKSETLAVEVVYGPVPDGASTGTVGDGTSISVHVRKS